MKTEREYYISRRNALISMGLCTTCGKEKVAKGKSTCHNCLSRRRERYRRMSPERRQDHIQQCKNRYEKMKMQGLCPVCENPAGEGRVYCRTCARRKKYD